MDNCSEMKMLQHIGKILGQLRQCSGTQYLNEVECGIILTRLYETGMRYDAVEIGSWNGITSAGMGMVAKLLNTGKKVYSIDNYVGHPNLKPTPEEARQNYWHNVQKNNVQYFCELIIGNSEDVEFDKPIGFLFIDGGHSYEQVKKDIEKWIPKVVKQGTVVFHDYSISHPQVVRAIEEANLGGEKQGSALYVTRI